MRTIFTLKLGIPEKRTEKEIEAERQKILKTVSEYLGVSIKSIKANNRNSIAAKARFISMYLMIQIPEMSLLKIASYFGRTHHTTTMHAIQTVSEMIEESKEYRNDIKNIINKLNN